MPVLVRALTYGVLGWTLDRAFTTLTTSLREGHLRSPSPQPELIPVYALSIAIEPLHRAMRAMPTPIRGGVYGAAFIAGEYAIGRAMRCAFGRAPWHYSGRWSIDGLTRLDYLPLWALAGLAFERIHHSLTT